MHCILHAIHCKKYNAYYLLYTLQSNCVDAMLGHSDLVNKEFPQHLLDLGVECIYVFRSTHRYWLQKTCLILFCKNQIGRNYFLCSLKKRALHCISHIILLHYESLVCSGFR